MTFVSSNEMKKKMYFSIRGFANHEIYICFTSLDEIKIIFTPKIGIFFLLCIKFIKKGTKSNILLCNICPAVLSLGTEI